jgi:hypothetical protein
MVDVPEVLIGLGLNALAAPLGNPLALRLTLPVNPPLAVMLTV